MRHSAANGDAGGDDGAVELAREIPLGPATGVSGKESPEIGRRSRDPICTMMKCRGSSSSSSSLPWSGRIRYGSSPGTAGRIRYARRCWRLLDGLRCWRGRGASKPGRFKTSGTGGSERLRRISSGVGGVGGRGWMRIDRGRGWMRIGGGVEG